MAQFKVLTYSAGEFHPHRMIKDKLAKIITAKPDTIQFAKDRKYEQAWIIPLSYTPPSQKEIKNYRSKDKFKTVIVEYIWNSQDNDNRFVLTIFLDKNCSLKDPKKFIDISLTNFYNYKNFETLINTFDKKVIGHQYLLTNSIESINVGVFNYWLSSKPVNLWKLGEKLNFEEIEAKIKSRPNIYRTSLNFQGLLFLFNVSGKFDGPYYGIKTPCCNKNGDEWTVDIEKVKYWIKLMKNI